MSNCPLTKNCVLRTVCEINGAPPCASQPVELSTTAPNTGSPKLPDYGEVLRGVFSGRDISDVPQHDANLVCRTYDFIYRQLRASA